jgi:hypothetical protein
VPSNVDPIFAAIEAHRAELRRHSASVEVSNQFEEGTPEWEELQDVNPDKFLLIVLTMTPTTLADVAAVLEHVTLPIYPDEKRLLPDDPCILFDAFDSNSPAILEAAKAFLPNTAATLRRLIAASA